MGEIQIIEHNGFRVVTSQQIAEAYGTESKQVSQGFNRNKGKFQEGKHYFILQGEELKVSLQSALSRLQISSKTRKLYLWTERGALLMAKIIDTDTAWEAYERLVDFYFDKKQEVAKAEPPESRGLYLPEQASVPAPLRTTWYSRNKNRIWKICEKQGIDHQELYHHILSKLGQTYDIRAAREIYKNDRGFYPEYAIDIVGYFPDLSKEADNLLGNLESELQGGASRV